MAFICIASVPNALNNNIIIFIVLKTRNSDYRRPVFIFIQIYHFINIL
jgi:hypothetical protein